MKNGHKCGKQEYLCRQCGKTFVSTTHTLMAHSHQPKQVWEAVLMDTLAGDAIDYSAKQLEVSHDCVFYMRHKILLGLHGLLEETGVCLGIDSQRVFSQNPKKIADYYLPMQKRKN